VRKTTIIVCSLAVSRINGLWVYKPVGHVTTAGGENSFMTPRWLPVVHASVTTTHCSMHCSTTHVQSSTTKLFTPCFCTRKLDSQVHARHSTMPYRNGRYEDINTSRKIPVYHGIPCFSVSNDLPADIVSAPSWLFSSQSSGA